MRVHLQWLRRRGLRRLWRPRGARARPLANHLRRHALEAPLVAAIERLARETPALAERLELLVAGRRTAAEEALLERLTPLPCRLVRHDYVDHHQAVGLLAESDWLLLLLAEGPGAGRVVPAKVFEYMATGRPILAIAPPGEVWELLADYPAVDRLAPGDVPAIAQALARRLEAFEPTQPPVRLAYDASAYERRRLTGRLAELLDSLLPDQLPVGVPAPAAADPSR
jgi:glycosyltransferase involved in cell wall biosynthesis